MDPSYSLLPARKANAIQEGKERNRFLKKVQLHTPEILLPHTMGGGVGNKWATQSILD